MRLLLVTTSISLFEELFLTVFSTGTKKPGSYLSPLCSVKSRVFRMASVVVVVVVLLLLMLLLLLLLLSSLLRVVPSGCGEASKHIMRGESEGKGQYFAVRQMVAHRDACFQTRRHNQQLAKKQSPFFRIDQLLRLQFGFDGNQTPACAGQSLKSTTLLVGCSCVDPV